MTRPAATAPQSRRDVTCTKARERTYAVKCGELRFMCIKLEFSLNYGNLKCLKKTFVSVAITSLLLLSACGSTSTNANSNKHYSSQNNITGSSQLQIEKGRIIAIDFGKNPENGRIDKKISVISYDASDMKTGKYTVYKKDPLNLLKKGMDVYINKRNNQIWLTPIY